MIDIAYATRCAALMATDRPDLWTVEKAQADVLRWSEYLDDVYEASENKDEAYYLSTGTGGFMFSRTQDDVSVEWSLSRSLFDYTEFFEEEDDTFDWTSHSELFKNRLRSI